MATEPLDPLCDEAATILRESGGTLTVRKLLEILRDKRRQLVLDLVERGLAQEEALRYLLEHRPGLFPPKLRGQLAEGLRHCA